MKSITMGAAGAAGMLLFAGCVELAEMPEGAREQEWRQVISESYSGWKPPRHAAPAQMDNVSPELLAAADEAAAPAEAVPAEPLDDAVAAPAAEPVAPAEAPAPAEAVADPAAPAEAPAPAEAAEATEKAEAAAPAEGAEATEKAEAAPAPEVKYEEYTVVAGDSLSKISQKVYRDGRLYYRIFKANEELLKGDPNKLRIGMKLRIPAL